MSDQPSGPKAPAMPPTLGAMRDAARAVLAEINRLADELPPSVALSPTNIVKTTVNYIDPDGLALRLYESKHEEDEQ